MLVADSHLRNYGVEHGVSKTLIQAIAATQPSVELRRSISATPVVLPLMAFLFGLWTINLGLALDVPSFTSVKSLYHVLNFD